MWERRWRDQRREQAGAAAGAAALALREGECEGWRSSRLGLGAA